jgi:1-acyl-sn-glycerol-3-phosphate acyltransferase
MWAYTRAAFRVTTLFPPGFRARRGVMLVATHRAESDVPVICAAMFLDAGIWRQHDPRLHFAARDDMFEQGFFAGFPPALPRAVRRLLWHIDAGPYLPKVRVNPLPYPSADTMRLGRALAGVHPSTPLTAIVPSELAREIEARARRSGLAPPVAARDVLRGDYADLLWRVLTRDELDAPELAEAWRRRADDATESVRDVVELVRAGEPVLFFPEGRPSPSGEIGPLRPGMRLLVRRGRPEALRALGLAYDPMTCGRPFVTIAAGPEESPRVDGTDDAVLAMLRRTMPLTCGQVVARELRAGRDGTAIRDLEAALVRSVELAVAEQRPVADTLRDAGRRRERLADALRFLLREGLARRERLGMLAIDGERVAVDERLARLAAEHRSAQPGD